MVRLGANGRTVGSNLSATMYCTRSTPRSLRRPWAYPKGREFAGVRVRAKDPQIDSLADARLVYSYCVVDEDE